MINGEHVQVIRDAMAAIPAGVDTVTRGQIEVDLVRAAIGVGPKQLKDTAERTIFLLDQDGPEPDETERARRRGVSAGPQQPDGLIAAGRNVLESGDLGQHNGLPTTIIIRTTLQDLESRAGIGVTGGGTVMPIRDVIRLGGHSHHNLAVFDGATGSALELFRTRRVASPAQRIMLIARDWADNGQTNIDELALACGPDNRIVGPGGWTTRVNDTTAPNASTDHPKTQAPNPIPTHPTPNRPNPPDRTVQTHRDQDTR